MIHFFIECVDNKQYEYKDRVCYSVIHRELCIPSSFYSTIVIYMKEEGANSMTIQAVTDKAA